MAEPILVTYSLTEVPHFGRLVEFVADVYTYANETDDYALQGLVDTLRDDLIELTKRDEEDE